MSYADFRERFAAARHFHQMQSILHERGRPGQTRAEFEAEEKSFETQRARRTTMLGLLQDEPGAVLEALNLGTEQDRETVARLLCEARNLIGTLSRED